jgi:integrase
MALKALPYVKYVKARGRDYWYFDTGTTVNGKPVYKRLPHIKDAGFGASYASFMAGRTRRANIADHMTVTKLIELFEASNKFKSLAVGTKKNYAIHLRKIETLVGKAPVNELEPRDVTRMMDELSSTPGTANMILAVIGAVYKWGRQRHHVLKNINPTQDIAPFELGSHDPWPENVLNDALASDNDRVRLAAHLLYYTAQRIGDVCRMRWNDIRGNVISVVQEKTDTPLEITLHSALAAELARTPRRGMTILTNWQGGPISDQPIRTALKKHVAGYGLDLVPHGLRKNAVIALLEAGCSVAETASVSGQSFPMVEYYAKLRNQKRLSSAAILKWEAKR